MLSVSAEESRKRALTIKIDRWTYSLIGIDFGFAIGSTLLSDTFNFDWASSVLPGDGGGMPTFLVGTIALAGIILFLMRPHFDYTLESVTKRYFTLSVSFCVLTMIVASPPVRYACLALLLVIVIIQLAIVVSAGVEFIDFDELSPVWYLAEEAFVSGGIALGIIIGGCISNFEVSGASLFPSCCIILTLINIFMQPKIDKGAYPSSKSIDDVLKGGSEESTPPRQIHCAPYRCLVRANFQISTPRMTAQKLLPTIISRRTHGKPKSTTLLKNMNLHDVKRKFLAT